MMQFITRNLPKIFLIGFLTFSPVFSLAQEMGNCTFQQSTNPGYTEIQCEYVGGTWSPYSNTTTTPNALTYPNEPDALNYPDNPNAGKLDNPLGPGGVDSIPEFIRVILEGVLKIGIPLIALAIIYCGFLFVEARGKPEKLTKAKDALLYTLIGAAILLGSWAIAQMISETVLAL